MTTELTCLSACAVMALALPLIYMPLYQKQVGQSGVSGPREGVPEPMGAAGRGLRAHRNLIENLVPFAVAVLVAHALGISNSVTVTGALIFLAARIAHAVTYLLAIPVARSLAYVTGVVGTAMILWQVF